MASTARSTKSTLAFGLVTCDVALYKTSSEAKAQTFEWAGPSGGKLTLTADASVAVASAAEQAIETRDDALSAAEKFAGLVADTATAEDDEPTFVEEGTGALVKKSERRRGIHREDGSFIDLTDGLEEIAEATLLDEMRVADFIRTEQVHRDRVIGSYYLAPDGPEAAKVIRLMYEAMRRHKRAAVVKFTKRTKQNLAVLIPHFTSGSLMVLELAWAEDVRAVPDRCLAVQQAAVTDDEIAVAEEMVEAMSSTKAEALDTLRDDARRLTAELIESGGEVLVPERVEVESGSNVIDLMQRGLRNRDELERSVA